jgi:hypothetical protein
MQVKNTYRAINFIDTNAKQASQSQSSWNQLTCGRP